MADDWAEAESSEEEVKPVPKKIIPAKKWDGEDEEDNEAPDDWEESSEEEQPAKPAAPVAPPKKKGTLKAKIAEKEAAKALKKNNDTEDDSELEDVVDPAERKRLDRERELKADLSHAAELFGTTAISSSSDLNAILKMEPRSKEDFQELSSKIIEVILKRHESKPLYAAFIEHHVRALAMPLKDVEVRKAASALTTLANEKQKEQRDKASGKKKSKAAAKPALGGTKGANKLDATLYDEVLDDFGANADDFM
ncbi:hypothetical protein Clacol_002606 [Clathrus columnatus]|uniref:Eukaryotic translation initiation factor 3 subunit J n=1 Tax=Clathrus columnatus TaxID=1419009 RepID=A0AAV5A751_9AGAM|nr:hypothetical protein Clacol_002606 [Clathrus columnatus]